MTFSSSRLSLLDRGVTVAIAHVRGGGEHGQALARRRAACCSKRNTFTDFIAAADALVARGYTARDRLVIEGGSAGGLLIGAVLNMRPDLCPGRRAPGALRRRDQHHARRVAAADGRRVRGVGQPQGPRALRVHEDVLPVHEPRRRSPYPPILVRTSLNDSQVMYWEPAKWVAQAAGAEGRPAAPLLFKINMAAGHGGSSGPLRRAPRARLRLHVGARRARPRARRCSAPRLRSRPMKIAKVEHLHADAGQRNFDFLKITTDNGLVGWSEYNESFGGLGVSAVIDGLAPHGDRQATRGRTRRSSPSSTRCAGRPSGGVDPAGDRRHRERAARRQGQGARRAGLRAARRAACASASASTGRTAGRIACSGRRRCRSRRCARCRTCVNMGKEVVSRGYTALKTNVFVLGRRPLPALAGLRAPRPRLSRAERRPPRAERGARSARRVP